MGVLRRNKRVLLFVPSVHREGEAGEGTWTWPLCRRRPGEAVLRTWLSCVLRQFLHLDAVGLQELARHRTMACGTVRMNRKELPADVKKTKLKVPGELLTRQSGNLLLTIWHDKRQVAVLSTNQNAGSIDITRRNGTVVSKPTAVANYNKYMGGVDLCDQNMSYYPAGRESKKWWKYLMWNFFNLAIVNAFVLYTENVPAYALSQRYTQLDFRLDLEEQLRDGFSSRTPRLYNCAITTVCYQVTCVYN